MDPNLIPQCEAEPLHLSGAIQGHGTLIVADPEGQVTHIAGNAAEFLPPELVAGPGRWRLPELLAGMADRLAAPVGSRLRLSAAIEDHRGLLDACLSRNADGHAIFEFTRVGEWVPPGPASFVVPHDPTSLERARQALLERVFQITGFHRIMYYIFREDGDGEVVAEVREPGVYGSYLGLRYPASDVPQIARKLYLLNPWRLISDAAAPPVALGGPRIAPPDLSYSDLRSASPVHCLYLANMGVRASLSFPLVKGEELTGLVACHHKTPRTLSMRLLGLVENEVRMHALAVATHAVESRMKMVAGLNRLFEEVSVLLRRAGKSLLAAWPELGGWLKGECDADGAWLCCGNAFASCGAAPTEAERTVLNEWLSLQPLQTLWACESLSAQFAGVTFSNLAGLLGVRLRLADGQICNLYVGRREYVHEVAWGGNPEKPLESDEGGLHLAPRRSFEKWVGLRTGHCRSWGKKEHLLMLKLRTSLLEGGSKL